MSEFKRIAILAMLIVLVMPSAFAASTKKVQAGEEVSLSAMDTSGQEGVNYDFQWTVQEVDSQTDKVKNGDLIANGRLPEVTGATDSNLKFSAPVASSGQSKKYRVTTWLTADLDSSCVASTTMDIEVEGVDSKNDEFEVPDSVCESANCEFERKKGDKGLEMKWFVDDNIEITDQNDHKKGKINWKDQGLAPGKHTVKLVMKDKGKDSEETVVEREVNVIRVPEPVIQDSQ